MRWAWLLVLLLAGPVQAQGRLVRQGGGGPVLDRYVFAPSGATVMGSYRGTELTVTGPATTVCDPTRTPQCWTAPADTLAVGPSGALVYGARTSRMLNNQRSSVDGSGGMGAASWVKRGTASVAPECVIAPDGSCTADRITVGETGANDIYQITTGFTASGSTATTVWVRIESGASGRVQLPRGSTETMTVTGPVWRLVSFVGTASATGERGMLLTSGSSALSVMDIWRPWQHEGTESTPDAEVGDAPLSVAETTAAVTIQPGAQSITYTVDGVRQTADVSALASPLIIGGAGPLGPINGALLDLVFCRVPGGCQ